jgi:hypothetical protein
MLPLAAIARKVGCDSRVTLRHAPLSTVEASVWSDTVPKVLPTLRPALIFATVCLALAAADERQVGRGLQHRPVLAKVDELLGRALDASLHYPHVQAWVGLQQLSQVESPHCCWVLSRCRGP